MHHIYDDGGLPGEGGNVRRCPIDCIHGCPECLPEEPEVTLDDAPACPVHGRDWLAIVDNEVVCAAPCPSDAGSVVCEYYRLACVGQRDIEAAAIAIRAGQPADDKGWIDLDALRKDIAAVSGDLAPLVRQLAILSVDPCMDGALREALLEAAEHQARRSPMARHLTDDEAENV